MRHQFIRLMLLTVAVLSSLATTGQKLKIGDKAPMLTNAKWVKPETQIELNDRPLFIDFWATWCAPCVAEFPKINDLQAKYGDRIHFVSISVEPKEKLQSFLTRKSITAFVLSDVNSRISNEFNVNALPTKFLLDKNGRIVWIGIGATKNLDSLLVNYLNGKSVSNFYDSGLVKKQLKMRKLMLPDEITKNILFTCRVYGQTDKITRKMLITAPDRDKLLILGNNLTISDLLKKHFKNSDLRYESTELKKYNIDYETTALDEQQSYKQIAEHLAGYDLKKIITKKKSVQGFAIRVANGELFKSILYNYQSATGILINDQNWLEFNGGSLNELEAVLEEKFHVFFSFDRMDKTILTSLFIDVSSLESLKKELLSKAGLELVDNSLLEVEITEIR